MTSIAARAGPLLALFAVACGALPAQAQFGALERAYSRFTGGMIWDLSASATPGVRNCWTWPTGIRPCAAASQRSTDRSAASPTRS